MGLAADITRIPSGPGRGDGFDALLANTAAASPYLGRLIEMEAAWLNDLRDREPGAVADDLIAEATGTEGDPSDDLRRLKGRAALLCALADLGGAWRLPDVTGTLTRLADAALRSALCHSTSRLIDRGVLPDGAEDEITVLAMGKMGAGELNYSSDIDLIFLHAGGAEMRAGAIRATRDTVRILSELTPEGYVFRTDLRLRPDPSVTPVCVAIEGAERYYESLGRTWERAAHIKARPAAGSLSLGEAYLSHLRPFVWRRHLDFAAVEDVRDMGRRIREAKGLHGPITVPGHDLKLGRGGIRAIEFAAQTGQLIFGGRDEALRMRGTVEALNALVNAGRMAGEDAAALTEAYGILRTAEHRLQMIRDAQTHVVPTDGSELARVAALCGEDAGEFTARIGMTLERVHEITGDLMGEGRSASRPAPASWRDTLDRWHAYPAMRSERAKRSFERIEGELTKRIDASARPEEAVRSLEGFLGRLPAGAQLFSLFEANPQLMDLIVDIASTAPGLAAYLGEAPEVLDAVVGGSFFELPPSTAVMVDELRDRISREVDYEARLDAARAWHAERHFQIGVHLLRGLIDAEASGRFYAQLAEATLIASLPEVCRDVERRYGAVSDLRLCVLGMGSLGAGWLHAGSDLDLIVIYDGAGTSDGRRALDARSWAGKLTQALVTALSAPMSRGRLYEVDLRLRPSGRQGPVATSWAAFQDYQRTQAWVWEHLALTRARPVAGSVDLMEEVAAFRDAFLSEIGDPVRVADGLAEMRERLFAARTPSGPWDMRAGPGGGQDVELFAQARTLIGDAMLDTHPAEAVGRVFETQRVVRAVTSLVSPDRPLEMAGEGAMGVVLRETGFAEPDALLKAMDGDRAEAADEIDTHVALWRSCRDPAA